MNIKKFIFVISALAVAGIATTSCSGASYSHTASKFNKVYHADLNHDGRIHDFVLEGKTIHEDQLTWIEAYDNLINEANSMAELNAIADALNIAKDELKRTSLARYEILHEAEELLMSTGLILPIYNYGDPYLLKPDITGIYTMNLGYKFLDHLEWKGHSNNFTVSVGTKAESFDPAVNSDVSTTLAMNQFLIGAKRYVDGGQDPIEKPGIHIAKLGDGICEVDKKLVVLTEGEEDEDHIWYEHCDDLKQAIDGGFENAEDYEGTARYYLKVRDNAVWNDGSKIVADDFIYEWTRASSGVYNGQGFGVWCSMFDMIRGYNAWNTVGQQKSLEAAKASEGWKDLNEAEQNQYTQVFSGVGDYPARGCAGGMAGIIKTSETEFEVQLINDCDYFESLLACPMYNPVAKKNVIKPYKPGTDYEVKNICSEDTDWWLNSNHDYLTNGPLEINGAIDNVDSGGIKLKKATHYTPGIGMDNTTTESIFFKFIDKDSTIYDAYKSNAIQFTNQFPSTVIDYLMKKPDWHAAQQLGLFFYSFNVNDNTFDMGPEGSDKEKSERNREYLRKAAILLANRDDLSTNVAKKGCYASNGFVSDGIIESCVPVKKENIDPSLSPLGETWAYYAKVTDGEYETANWQDRNLDAYPYLKYGEDYTYKDHILENRKPGGFMKIADEETTEQEAMKTNTDLAIEYATKAGVKFDKRTGKFVNFPRLNVITNNGSGLEDIVERMQFYYGLWGINMSINTQEWQSFLVTRRQGDFAMARQGWVADYNDPRTYLDLCTSTSGNNDTQLGRDNHHKSR